MTDQHQLTLLLHWEGAIHLIFDLCLKMPRRAHLSFVTRLEGLSLDVLSMLTEARYASRALREPLLKKIDQALAQLRALSRIAHKRQLISHRDFEALSCCLDEAGRMLGGWIKSERSL